MHSQSTNGRGGDRPVHSDPADLFVEIYDALPDALFRGDEVEGWFREPEFRSAAERVATIVEDRGRLDREDIDGLLGWPGHKGQLALAVGLDEALSLADPSRGPLPAHSPLTAILHRYLGRGRLNDSTAGALLLRRTYPGRVLSGKEKREYFTLLRVSANTWENGYSHSAAISATDPWFDPGQAISVGFAPVLTSYDELDMTFPRRYGQTRYRLAPKDRVLPKLERVLDALDRSGVTVGVLPEAALSDELYTTWIKLMRRKRPGRHSRLRWILLGSGPVRGSANRAVLVDRWTGREVLFQDKLADFSLTDWQFDKWRLPRPNDSWDGKSPVREDIARDVTFHTVDTIFGRLGVLICESLTRWPDNWNDAVAESGVSHIFAPIFSKPIMAGGWEAESSSQLMNRIGSWVMVANSLATTRTMAPTRVPDPDHRWFSFAVVGPYDRTRRSYRAHRQYGQSKCAHDIAVVDLQETDDNSISNAEKSGNAWPWVRAAELRLDDWFPERRPTERS